MACPGGCFGGGGQIRYDGVKNKEIILEFEEMVKRYGGKEEEGRVELGGWDKLGVKKERALVKYRPIEKKMS
jgi:iron only hydrogenase large subunit-like protein